MFTVYTYNCMVLANPTYLDAQAHHQPSIFKHAFTPTHRDVRSHA
jgi:hypothetical protein